MAYTRQLMIDSGSIFLVLPIIAVALRVWAKYLGQKRLGIDDYFVFVALLGAVGCCVTLLVGATLGGLAQHQVDLPNGLPDLQNEKFIVYEKAKFALQLLTPVGFGCVKASFLFFYLQIFGIVKSFRRIVWCMLALVAIWTIAVFFACLFTCTPVTVFVEAFYGNKCIDGKSLWLASAASDFTLDLIILIMPLPMVFRLQASMGRKLAIAALFTLGGGVCGISLTRFVEFYEVIQHLATAFADETYITSPPFFWTAVEGSTSVVLACLPTYGPIIKLFTQGSAKAASRRLLYYSGFGSSKSYSLSETTSSEDSPSFYPGHGKVKNYVSTNTVRIDDNQDLQGITVERVVVQNSKERPGTEMA